MDLVRHTWILSRCDSARSLGGEAPPRSREEGRWAAGLGVRAELGQEESTLQSETLCQRRHSHGGLGGPGSEIAGPRWPHRSQADKSQSSLPAPQRDPLSAGTRGRCWSLPGLIRLQCRQGQRASQGREAGSAPDTPAGPQLRGRVAQGPTHARTHARSPERSEAAGPAALDRKALGGGQSQRLLSSSFGARERFSNK